MNKTRTLFFISLGCAKNRVDSEHMLGILKRDGYEPVDEIEQAGCVVINTCGFLQEAVQEAIDTILDAARFKERGTLKKLVVAGCFVQRYGYKLRTEIPEVDGWLGTAEIHRIVDVLKGDSGGETVPMHISRPVFPADHCLPRIRTTPFYTAYLRIAEGCANRCSYCLIPKLRGPFRSRAMDALFLEASEMAAQGVRELNLVAQDTSRYGEDIYGERRIMALLEGLSLIEGFQWIRLLYFHPDRLTETFLDFMDENERIVPYLDLPFQHSHPAILKAMRRDSESTTPWDLMTMIRNRKRRIYIRTSLMVGYPGETEEMFESLCDFVKMARFDHLGVFVFSPEEGTSAFRLPDPVDHEIALERQKHLMNLQAGISKSLNQAKVREVLPVLIEGESSETDLLLEGRTAGMAPDVDSRVLINEGEGRAGEIMPVLITEAHEYDLVGRILMD
ncbi:MAG: 30S ribosomal protein S12 methylthiotransferase RimO [Deltaproteobacteria bacterium]|nr:30S ribosomal protein S12 methylthiotransferase RimO [Deltaproteobacteria bacterium]